MSTKEQLLEEEILEQTNKKLLNEALVRLKRTPEYKLVIEQIYLLEYAAKLVTDRSDPRKQSAQDQTLLNKAIDGVGSFSHFLKKIETEGNLAESAIKDSEDELVALHNLDNELED